VGEQSNAYRILLRYDRKSRHRRIKKQRRYERLAATSQFRTTKPLDRRIAKGIAHFWVPIPVDGLHLSVGRSPYLKPAIGLGGNPPQIPSQTHNLPSVEQRSFASLIFFFFAGRIVVLRIASILWDYYPRPPQPINVGLLRSSHAWYPGPNKVSPHPVVLPKYPDTPKREDYPLLRGVPPLRSRTTRSRFGHLPRAD
jgi:hypothetical protein